MPDCAGIMQLFVKIKLAQSHRYIAVMNLFPGNSTVDGIKTLLPAISG